MKLALLADAKHVNISRWCDGLTSAGAEIHLLSLASNSTNSPYYYSLTIPCVPGKLRYLAALPVARLLINNIRPNITLAYYVTGYGTLGALSGCHPLVQVTSGSDILVSPRNRIMRQLVRFNLGHADLVTAWAPHMGQVVRTLGVEERRLLVLAPGIRVEDFARTRSPIPTRNDSLRIIVTRSLKSYYKHHLLLIVASSLRKAGVDFELTFAGDGPERDNLEFIVSKMNLERHVRFIGFVPNQQLPKILERHNFYISLVPSDGVSASLLEAMCSGQFPIASNHPANREWIESERNGLLISDLSPEAIAANIQRVFSDLSLRQYAWERNLDIVRERADLFRNSSVYMAQFRQLAGGT